MALVAYDSSEGSDSEPEADTKDASVPYVTTKVLNALDDKIEDFIPKAAPPPPPPKRKKVQISVPALSSFKDQDEGNEEPRRKQFQASGGASRTSGLLSILPPAKNTPLTATSFVPNVVTTAKAADATHSHLIPQAVKKRAELAKKATLKKLTENKRSDSGQDEGDAKDVDDDDDDIKVPDTFDEEMWQKVCSRKIKPVTPVEVIDETSSGLSNTNTTGLGAISNVDIINLAPAAPAPYEGLDNKAFKELVGKSRRQHLNYKLIDVNEEDVIKEHELMLTKSITDPDTDLEQLVDNPVDPTRRKKHHITYLAEQAKSNEAKLESQWSASKQNRNQSRAKYGF